jgi:hypothetical protein
MTQNLYTSVVDPDAVRSGTFWTRWIRINLYEFGSETEFNLFDVKDCTVYTILVLGTSTVLRSTVQSNSCLHITYRYRVRYCTVPFQSKASKVLLRFSTVQFTMDPNPENDVKDRANHSVPYRYPQDCATLYSAGIALSSKQFVARL